MYDGIHCDLEGTNAKMNEFQASMGLCNLNHFDEQIQLRKTASEYYRERLESVSALYIPPKQRDIKANYAYFPVRVLKNKNNISRDDLVDLLAVKEIGARKYFYPLTSAFQIVQENYIVQETPIAQEISNEILCLPLYAGLTCSEIDTICNIIEAVFNG